MKKIIVMMIFMAGFITTANAQTLQIRTGRPSQRKIERRMERRRIRMMERRIHRRHRHRLVMEVFPTDIQRSQAVLYKI